MYGHTMALLFNENRHKTAIFPVLQKLTHVTIWLVICIREASFLSLVAMNVLRVTDIYWFIPSSSQVTLAFCIETVSNLIFYPSLRLIIKICIRHGSIIKVFGCVTFINVFGCVSNIFSSLRNGENKQ